MKFKDKTSNFDKFYNTVPSFSKEVTLAPSKLIFRVVRSTKVLTISIGVKSLTGSPASGEVTYRFKILILALLESEFKAVIASENLV